MILASVGSIFYHLLQECPHFGKRLSAGRTSPFVTSHALRQGTLPLRQKKPLILCKLLVTSRLARHEELHLAIWNVLFHRQLSQPPIRRLCFSSAASDVGRQDIPDVFFVPNLNGF